MLLGWHRKNPKNLKQRNSSPLVEKGLEARGGVNMARVLVVHDEENIRRYYTVELSDDGGNAMPKDMAEKILTLPMERKRHE